VNDSSSPKAGNQGVAFLSGGGELGQLIRDFDWAAGPCGPPQTWPQNLRMALRIMLTSRQPMWIGWGDELTYFYNDPYKAIIGGKHPWALGRPTSVVWREIWADIGPMLDTALRGDQGTYVESQLLIMERNGYPEETYYTFSYSPIPNDDGSVGGIICANSEDTQRVIGERQLALLRNLATSTAHARSRADICVRAAAELISNAQDLPFALIYMPEGDGSTLRLAATAGIDLKHPAAPDRLSLLDAVPWPVGDVLGSQSLRVVDDLPGRFDGSVPRGPWPRSPAQAAILPIGESGRAGVLIVGLNPFRLFDDSYRSFLQLVAGQIAAAIANAQAYEEERLRAEALAEIDRAKTQFFSNVSHEFRTPLTLMLAPLEDALNDRADELSHSQRERIHTAHRNSLRLLRLVNTLLDFSRIEAGRVEANFQPTDLSHHTAELASTFQSVIEKADLTLKLLCPPLPESVYVDPDMWEKIVLNLLSNAFKFTFSGAISVETRISQDGRSAELVVRDTGVGIPAEELPRLFERFHRVEGQRSRSFEGSGIGLALVQELVKLHGGSITAESRQGHGTTFTVSLPLGNVHLGSTRTGPVRGRVSTTTRVEAYIEEVARWLPESASTADEFLARRSDEETDLSVPGEHHGARVLIADDNADMRNYVRRLLGARWTVLTASDGKEALELIRSSKPDLVLSDVMMPQMDGFQLLRELRADPQLRNVPVILLSARAGEDARVEGLDAGADDYLTKPFSARELIARVNANLEMGRLRREATRELRESEARFRNMAENSPVMMWMTDRDGELVYLNRGWSEFTGQTTELALGQGAWEMLHPDDRDRAHRTFFDANAAREAFRIEYRLRHPSGEYRWAMSAASPRFSDEGEFLGYIGSLIDISDRKEAERILQEANEVLEARVNAAIAERAETEAQLRQAQKMEAVGRLTGGVAHDFNNVLQIISGNLQLLARDVSGSLRGEQRLASALSALDRGSKLASQLLAFGRRQPLAPKVVHLGRLIRGTTDMLRRALGEGIEIETIVGGGLWNTFVDGAQVENALLNLAINSRDAMNGQGKLTIESGNAFLDDAYAIQHADVVPGQYVMLAVTDTGSGISPDIIERVFEPFFTTKPEGQGTGLGLSMVYGFVKQSGGHISIYSEPGQGTTIRIYLPRSRQPEDAAATLEAGAADGGTESVLVVEDDDDLRGTVVDLLSDLGYRVLKARDAQSALAIVESGVPIDLIFTDVVMPGPLRSPELARRARERIPGVAVLFTSGYTQNAIVHGGRLDEGVDLLSKPYSRDALARKVRHVLRNQHQRNLANSLIDQRAAHAAVVPGAARVLLVEDDPDIRRCTAGMLAHLGFAVIEAGNGMEALKHIEAQPVDVLVTDLSLPGMQGSELAERALIYRPDLAIVFASGYDANGPAQKIAGAICLLKPYDEQALRKAVETALSNSKKSAPRAGPVRAASAISDPE
jgi:PAS domain S-box-containing protein